MGGKTHRGNTPITFKSLNAKSNKQGFKKVQGILEEVSRLPPTPSIKPICSTSQTEKPQSHLLTPGYGPECFVTKDAIVKMPSAPNLAANSEWLDSPNGFRSRLRRIQRQLSHSTSRSVAPDITIRRLRARARARERQRNQRCRNGHIARPKSL